MVNKEKVNEELLFNEAMKEYSKALLDEDWEPATEEEMAYWDSL